MNVENIGKEATVSFRLSYLIPVVAFLIGISIGSATAYFLKTDIGVVECKDQPFMKY